jgi:hypothetical protein
MKAWLFRPPSLDDLIQVLQAWRIWLLATLIGALLGSAVYAFWPPVYRAQATVTVDNNLEQAWPNVNTERDLMTYLSRETQKLIQVAWEDATLGMVVEQVPGVSIDTLREDVLQLSQPSEGAWHFWAKDPDPERASLLASAWARAFYERSLYGVKIAARLEAAQAALLLSPSDPAASAEIQLLENESLGISSYLQLSLSQSEQIPVRRTSSQMVTILAGAIGAWVVTFFMLLFIGPGKEKRANP